MEKTSKLTVQYKSEILSTLAVLFWNLGLLYINIMQLVDKPTRGYLTFTKLSILLAPILTITTFVYVRGLRDYKSVYLLIVAGWILLTSSIITAHPGFLVAFLMIPLCWPIILIGPAIGLYGTIKAWHTETHTINLFLLFLIIAWTGWMFWYYVEVGYFVVNPKFIP